MLGTEPRIIERYIETGQVRLVFWPMLDHGDDSLNSHAAADCAGRQEPNAFWQLHDEFFANQNDLWGAGRDYFVNAAVAAGVDKATFEACYDSGEGHATVTAQDRLRRNEGIFSRPTFYIGDQILVGAQPFEVFEQVIEAALP